MSVITKNRESRVVRKGAPKKKPETTGTTKAEAKGDKTSISRESRTEKSEKSDGRTNRAQGGFDHFPGCLIRGFQSMAKAKAP